MRGLKLVNHMLRNRLSGGMRYHGMPAFFDLGDTKVLIGANGDESYADIKHPNGFTHITGRRRRLKYSAHGADLSRETISLLNELIHEEVYQQAAEAQSEIFLRALSMFDVGLFTKYLEADESKGAFWANSAARLRLAINERLASAVVNVPESLRFDSNLEYHAQHGYHCDFCNGDNCAYISANISRDEDTNKYRLTYNLRLNERHHYLLHPVAFAEWLETTIARISTEDEKYIASKNKVHGRRA